MLLKDRTLSSTWGAVTAVQLLDVGVYIAMNGKVFNWENVKKNFDIAEFQTLD